MSQQYQFIDMVFCILVQMKYFIISDIDASICYLALSVIQGNNIIALISRIIKVFFLSFLLYSLQVSIQMNLSILYKMIISQFMDIQNNKTNYRKK